MYKKLVATSLASLMAVATLLTAVLAATQLGDFPGFLATKTESGSTLNTLVVVGESAATSDVVGAIDLAAAMASESYEVVTTGGVTVAAPTVTSGASLSSAGNPLYLDTALSSVKPTFTSSDLSTLLAGGTYVDSAGNEYAYSQYIDIDTGGVVKVKYTTKSGTTMPALGLDIPAGSNLYKYRLVFSKPTGLDTATSLDILGASYTITSVSDSPKEIQMLSGRNAATMNTGETRTFTVDDKSYEITLNSIGTTSGGTLVALLTVNGEAVNVNNGQTKTLSDGTVIGASDIVQVGSAGEGSAKIFVGAMKIKLSGSSLYHDNTVVNGVTVSWSGYPSANLTQISVSYAPTTEELLQSGESVTDPAFSAFKILFGGIAPSLDDTENRETITIQPSSTSQLGITFTTSAGYSLSQNFAYNASGALDLSASGSYAIHVVEGKVANLNDYIVVSQYGTWPNVYGHILQFTSITQPTSSSPGTVTLRDVASGDTTSVSIDFATGSGTMYLDGFAYTVANTTSANQIVIKWHGTTPGSSSSNPLAVYPAIATSKGALVAFAGPMEDVISFTAAGTKWLELPSSTSKVNVTYDGTSIFVNGINIAAGAKAVQVGKVFYVFSTDTGNDVDVDVSKDQTSGSTTGLGVPSIIFVENDDNNLEYHAIIVPSQGSTTQVGAASPKLTNGLTSLQSEGTTNYQSAMDYYGALVRYYTPTSGANSVTISYPSSQVTATVVVGATPTVTTTTTGAVTYNKIVPIRTTIAKLDSEVTDADKSNYNLVLVGGPCVNTLVADLAAAGTFDYTCDTWPGRDFALVKAIDDAYAPGKVVLVVAGTRAEDTRLATSALVMDKLAGQTVSAVEITGTIAAPVITAV